MYVPIDELSVTIMAREHYGPEWKSPVRAQVRYSWEWADPRQNEPTTESLWTADIYQGDVVRLRWEGDHGFYGAILELVADRDVLRNQVARWAIGKLVEAKRSIQAKYR